MKIQIGDEVRDMTDDELNNYEQVIEEQAAQIAAIASKAAAAASGRAKLAALGLTEHEINALLGA